MVPRSMILAVVSLLFKAFLLYLFIKVLIFSFRLIRTFLGFRAAMGKMNSSQNQNVKSDKNSAPIEAEFEVLNEEDD